jgi:predicted lysophospholipase L1 biosynthesis ABC-type transport system permease subunit
VLGLRTGGVPVGIRVDGLTPLVPGAAAASDLVGATTSLGGAARAETVVVDYPRLARSLVEGGASGPLVDEWWIDVPPGTSAAYIDSLSDDERASATSGDLLGAQLQEAPLRVATQAALWVAVAASAALAAVGFGVQSASSLRARRLELAQLRAIGFSRRRLVGLIAVESVLMSVLGSVFGVGIGVLLALLVAPLVAVSPTGIPPVPSVVVEIPGWGLVVLVLTVVATLTVVVAVVANVQRFTEPAHLLREGAQA